MREIGTAHVSTWLQCLFASLDLEHSLELDGLTDWLHLPPSYGGSGLNSLSRSADEELLGSFAGIAASPISFCRKTDLPLYIRIAQELESLGDGASLLSEETPPSTEHPCASLKAIRAAPVRSSTSLSPPSVDELSLATHLARGHSIIEVPGEWSRLGDTAPDLIVLP
jgi:hypothetical protein